MIMHVPLGDEIDNATLAERMRSVERGLEKEMDAATFEVCERLLANLSRVVVNRRFRMTYGADPKDFG